MCDVVSRLSAFFVVPAGFTFVSAIDGPSSKNAPRAEAELAVACGKNSKTNMSARTLLLTTCAPERSQPEPGEHQREDQGNTKLPLGNRSRPQPRILPNQSKAANHREAKENKARDLEPQHVKNMADGLNEGPGSCKQATSNLRTLASQNADD